ncbi:MAG: hypothetical protein Q9181_000003 [Wetmoreana brouardii]
MATAQPDQEDLLRQILGTLQSVQNQYSELSLVVQNIGDRLDVMPGEERSHQNLTGRDTDGETTESLTAKQQQYLPRTAMMKPSTASQTLSRLQESQGPVLSGKAASPQRSSASGTSSRIVLTTYPGDLLLCLAAKAQSDAETLSVLTEDVEHKPDFTNSEPAVNLGPFTQWADARKIVSLDPWGHVSPWLFAPMIQDENVHIRPTIAITKAHMKLPELEQSVRAGRLIPDGKICLNATGELAVTKFAVEPVWYLPGVAERFGIDEGNLRRSLFENTGGSFPELITRGDMKLFLPPIGGLTVYCFGDPRKMSDPNVKLALRIHDECNGSDVFGSDICTCRPYLIFGVEEAVKEAQAGGSGVVVYFRKEGRALGEVTKYLVYNARK